MPKKTDAREKAVRTAVRLFQQQGYHGTGLAQIVEESGCPKGSFYHHFPHGKEQLGLEALARADEDVQMLFEQAEQHSSRVSGYLRALTRGFAQRLEQSNYSDGCLLVGLAFETATGSAALSDACRQCYQTWKRRVAVALQSRGLAPRQAAAAGSAIVSALNGALVVCRTERSSHALRELGPLLATWLSP